MCVWTISLCRRRGGRVCDRGAELRLGDTRVRADPAALRGAFRSGGGKTPVLLLSAPVLLALWRYHGVVTDRHGPLEGCYFQFIFFFGVVGVLPALYARASGVRLSELGLGAGDARFGAQLLLLIPIMVLPVAYVASGMADVRAEYPMCQALYTRRDLVIWYELAYAAVFYTAWESYFRGFLLFGLKSELG